MTALNLSKNRRVRLWLDEDLPCEFAETAQLRTEIQSAAASTSVVTAVALELFVPEGGRFSYAMLGARFSGAGTGGKVEIAVNVADAGLRYPSALSGDLDEVRIGLPREYAAAVLEESKRAVLEKGTLPAGRLVVSCAAHGRVGSNRATFRRLASIIAQSLGLWPRETRTAAIVRLLEQ